MQTYDKTALLGFVFTQNALKDLFATLAHKAITRITLSLSLVTRTFWHAFALNLKGFFAHFVVVSSRFIVDFAHFIAISSYRKFFLFHRGFISYFCSFFSSFYNCLSFYHSFNSSFHSQKAFFRALRFFEIFKRFVFGLLRLLLQAVFVKTADFVILSAAKNPHKLKENLPFLDTSLALSTTKFMTQRVFGMARQIGMINLGCRLNFLKQMKNLKNSKNLQIF